MNKPSSQGVPDERNRQSKAHRSMMSKLSHHWTFPWQVAAYNLVFAIVFIQLRLWRFLNPFFLPIAYAGLIFASSVCAIANIIRRRYLMGLVDFMAIVFNTAIMIGTVHWFLTN